MQNNNETKQYSTVNLFMMRNGARNISIVFGAIALLMFTVAFVGYRSPCGDNFNKSLRDTVVFGGGIFGVLFTAASIDFIIKSIRANKQYKKQIATRQHKGIQRTK